MEPIEIHTEGVLHLLLNLKASKATGPDKIPCRFLKELVYQIAPALTLLYISHHLDEHNVICDEQHGFRSGRSCETQLLITIHDFANNLNNQKQTDAILLDFTKAFDKVSHRRLCSKLFHYGIRGNLLSWINDFLTDRTQRVSGGFRGVARGAVAPHFLSSKELSKNKCIDIKTQ